MQDMSTSPGNVEILVNGQKLHTLEMADIGSINTILYWSRFPVRGTSLPPRDLLMLDALHPMKNGMTSIPKIALKIGDEVTIRIVGPSLSDHFDGGDGGGP